MLVVILNITKWNEIILLNLRKYILILINDFLITENKE